MKGSVVRSMVVASVIFAAVAWTATPAHAVKEFFAEFEARYAKPNSRKRNEVALTRAIEEAKCTVCHPGDDKHKLTGYGTEVAKRINKFDKDKKKKIQDTLDAVFKLPSDAYNAKSPTFGAQMKQGKLPDSPE